MRNLTLAAIASWILLSFPSAARAQSVLVRVTAAESAVPLAGAFVTFLDPDGLVVRSGLTDEAGRFLFPVNGPGRLTVRAELIGRETRTSAPVDVSAAESVMVPLPLPVLAVALSEIRVEAHGRCQLRPGEASEIARVWEEARKPLAVQAWAEREGLHRLEITTWERDLDVEGRRVVREERRAVRRVTRVPFASLPPEDLIRNGFIREIEGGGHEYYGPDATLLLSDLFLDTHCMRLTRFAGEPGAIGLEFEPVERGEQADVRGVLWLDQETSALRHIEYTYTSAPWIEAVGVANGRVDYEVLPDGAWVIERWWIRAPIMARRPGLQRGGDSGIRVAGIRERGGEVVVGMRLTGTQSRLGSVRGVVWDSVASAPLAGATVFLSGTTHRAETNREGRFTLDAVPAGIYTVGFTHIRLDSMGVVPPVGEAEVTAALTSEIALAIPFRATILLTACQAEDLEAGGSVLTGIVTDRTSGHPVPGASVRVEWQEVERLQPVLLAKARFLEVRSDNDGRYTACGIPVDESIRVVASFLQTSGDEAATAFTEESHQALDLSIELPAGLFDSPPAGVTVLAREYGAQGVQGTLAERGSGKPIRAAVVTIRSLSGEVVARAETNDKGFFRITTPTPGRYLLSAQALGYGAIDAAAADVELGNLMVLDVRMAAEALELDPIVVSAEARSFHLETQGFYRRRDVGLGVHIPPEVIERRRAQKTTDLFFGIPRTRVIEPAGGGRGRAIRFSTTLECWPMVYVDRHLVSTGGTPEAGAEPLAIDDLVAPSDILAIEIFRSPAEIPSEFNGPNAGCGVVVLWTRRGGGE